MLRACSVCLKAAFAALTTSCQHIARKAALISGDKSVLFAIKAVNLKRAKRLGKVESTDSGQRRFFSTHFEAQHFGRIPQIFHKRGPLTSQIFAKLVRGRTTKCSEHQQIFWQ